MKAPKQTRIICVAGMAILAAGSLVVAALPAAAATLAATPFL